MQHHAAHKVCVCTDTVLCCTRICATRWTLLCAGSIASFCLRSSRHLAELSTRSDLPKMLIFGDRDQFSSLSGLQKVFKPHKQIAGLQEVPCSSRPCTHMEIMAECDHFFVNHRSELAKKVMHFCASACKEAQQGCMSQNRLQTG